MEERCYRLKVIAEREMEGAKELAERVMELYEIMHRK